MQDRRLFSHFSPAIQSRILSFLSLRDSLRASLVCTAWYKAANADAIWVFLLHREGFWFGAGSEYQFIKTLARRGAYATHHISIPPQSPYKVLFKSRFLTKTRWISNTEPKHTSFNAHSRSVITCLVIHGDRVISASDNHSIHVYSLATGHLIHSLVGHGGGIWSLAADKGQLVSGSTDRTIRIWDLHTGRCTHVFGGHASTVRCIAIARPEWIDMENKNGMVKKEKWPKRSLIVSGSRDHSLRVWLLPKPGEIEYRYCGSDDMHVVSTNEDVGENPYQKLHLEGHDDYVRALAAGGHTLVSGSYDSTVRVWDIITGNCKWVLVGHTQKVYAVVLDSGRNHAFSGSMDSTVRVWDLQTGECKHILTGHTSLVGLIGLSPSYLISASADSTLRIWDANSGELRNTLDAHTGAITCFQHDEFKVLSGSDGSLKMWDVRDGTIMRNLLTRIVGVWQVVFEGRWCVAASNRRDETVLDIWDFGNGVDDETWIGEYTGNAYDEDSADEEESEAETA